MDCLSCQKEIPTKLGCVSNSFRFCKFCFSHIIEKRVRKYLKEHSLKKDQHIVALDPVSIYFAQHVLHVPVTIIKKQLKSYDKEIVMKTLDDHVAAYLEHLFSGKKMKKQKKNALLLFSVVTDEELALYCQYHTLPFMPKKHLLKQFLIRMEADYHGTIQALYKSMKDLKEIM